MSFFYDILKELEIDEIDENVAISFIVNKGICVIGNIKINGLSEEVIDICCNNKRILIFGSNLKIKSMAKGEICIVGNVEKIDTGECL